MIKFVAACIDVIDIDNDGSIGFLDFVHFAERLKARYRDAAADAIPGILVTEAVES